MTIPIAFYKMEGCGNDFIVIDRRIHPMALEDMSRSAVSQCDRKRGIGADGIVWIDRAEGGGDYRWHFYNCDGSRARMCGNAARCVGWLAEHLGWAFEEHCIETDAGEVSVRAFPEASEGEVWMPFEEPVRLNLRCVTGEGEFLGHHVVVGVPHLVVFVESLGRVDVQGIGAALRYHEFFLREGTNVDFVFVKDRRHLEIRTYERGVEQETLACGTGAAASALIAQALGFADEETAVKTQGGEILAVRCLPKRIGVRGPVRLTFEGFLR